MMTIFYNYALIVRLLHNYVPVKKYFQKGNTYVKMRITSGETAASAMLYFSVPC